MLTAEENERLTRVGPGTPMGDFLRRYWFPVGTVGEMESRWTKRVRLLGEDLVLYRNRTGSFGLIGEACPHRRASLAYGIPTAEGIRCPYHGWQFNEAGRCIEQPNEPEGSNFKEKVWTAGYPVQALSGLLFAYLGPQPAPLIPRYDGLIAEGAIRMVGTATIDCNWLQIMENSADPVHTEWLHGKLYEFTCEKDNIKIPMGRHHSKIGFDEFDYGLIKRRTMEGQDENVPDWRIGHPLVFPNILGVSVGYSVPGGAWTCYELQFRVPIDDTTTQHYWFNAYTAPPHWAMPPELVDNVPLYDVKARDAEGNYLMTYIHGQDVLAWETQGKIASRELEHLGTTDRGVTIYRRMLLREMSRLQKGEDPMCVIRDAEKNASIDLPFENDKDMNSEGFEEFIWRTQVAFSPIAQQLMDVFRTNYYSTPQRVG
jgi:5,5'-dehydrodivanillate O-demethylase oxygenase subunit